MTHRSETLRRMSVDIYAAALDEAMQRFATLIQEDEIEPLYLTEKEYASGTWSLTKVYSRLLLRVRDEYLANEDYELSAAQIRHALLQGALKSGKLFVGGQLLREEPRVRQVTFWVARGRRRFYCSRRHTTQSTPSRDPK